MMAKKLPDPTDVHVVLRERIWSVEPSGDQIRFLDMRKKARRVRE